MNRLRFSLLSLVMLAGTMAVSLAQPQFEPTKEDIDKAAKRAKVVENLVTAHRLIAFGKGDLAELSGLTDYQSPEALVSAAGILLRVEKEAGAFDVITEKGEVAKDGKAPNYAEQAKALFAEARNLVKGNKAREADLEVLIKQAEKVGDGSRGAIGRPRTITKVLNPGQSVDITIGFQHSTPASVSYTTVGGPRQRCEIIGPNGRTLYDNTGPNGTHNWVTARDDGKRMITIRLTNNGGKTHTVTVTTN